ncbi:DUF11 domain-containing protein [Erythrobacter sp. F6033]|uniref:DUF11 domain-containing protein n=1 Tax=Erythrobacter sp. F6033 TaxID=2926401 RepID=UPI001FF670FB|nr:DUF11 domain-containing protein [Erythrobacter sp. F6033]MCK0127653.1 DUF11 domain-containing protein [Erythrobacter sp. F6033]
MQRTRHSMWNSVGRVGKTAAMAAVLGVSSVCFADEAAAQDTFTVATNPDAHTATYTDANGRVITVRAIPEDTFCTFINAAGYIGSFARSSVTACDRTIRFTFETSGFLVQAISINDIDDFDGTAPRDALAMTVAGTWTSPTIEVHSFASPPAFANQSARLSAAGGVGTFISNAAGDNPVDEAATFTMTTATRNFTLLHDDVQDGRNALFYFDLNNMQITSAAGSVVAVDDTGSVTSAAGGSALNVYTGDTLNTVAAGTTNTVVGLASGSTLPSGFTFNTATGEVSVAAGTPVGEYSFDYEICEIGFATNCQTATATVTVTGTVDLSVTKTNTPGVNGDVDQAADTVLSGSTTTYTINVSNGGPDPVIGALVTDTPGAGITCNGSNPITITGDGVPAGSFTFADLSGAGIALGVLSTGQTTTLSYSCQVN